MRKTVLFVLLLSLILIFTGCSAKTDSTAKGKSANEGKLKEVRIGYQVNPNAELLAKELGLVEKQFPDTKIQWIAFDSGRDVNTAIASGNIDLGLVGSVPLATGVATKLPYQVYFIHDVIGEAESLAVRKTAKIDRLEDLVGKKIAVPFGSTAHFSLLTALDQAGIDTKEVSILDMQPQDILAAWQRKDIDGAFVWHPTLGKILEGDGTILTSAKVLAEKGIVTSDVGIVHNAFAKAHPEFIKSYVEVLDKAVEQYREDPKAAAKTLAPALGLTEAQTKQQMEGLIWLSYQEQQEQTYLGTAKQTGQFANVLAATGKFLKAQSIIQQTPDDKAYQSAIYYVE